MTWHPKPRGLRRLMCMNLVITVLSLTLLLWTYSPARSFQFWSQYYRPIIRAELTHKITTKNTQPTGCSLQKSRLDGKKVPLVAVGGTHTLLVSAYLEHRTTRKEVRVIAVVLRSEAVPYRCLLCCQGQHHISAGETTIHSDHFDFSYGTADIMCPVPSGCEIPSHIAVTSVTAQSEGEEVFLEVLNQEARNDSFHHNFTVCFSTMFNFTNVLQVPT
ncbi:hypothetical protein LDENG_00242490 [Lucifuga dentata]|nr:hypothetical protein LDENG_00242490 [Lucifuga dentata]